MALPGAMKLHSVALTHVGRRDNNEDALFSDSSLGLFAVADGLGGYEGGEVASRLAIHTLVEFVKRNLSDEEVTWPHALDRALTFDENMAMAAARLAHERILRQRRGKLAQMGSTLALLLSGREGKATVAHIGDSRVYRLRQGRFEGLTVDHSFYEELVRSGASDLPPRHEFPYTNIITRALGISGSAEVQTIELAAGDIYLLCTDGLSEVVNEACMSQILAGQPLASACGALIDAAYEGGGKDNITAVLVQCDHAPVVRSRSSQ
jgi:PPM family protein phosphatase